MGHLTRLGAKDSCEIFHDPFKGRSEEGKIQKVLKAEPLPDGIGHFFNLRNHLVSSFLIMTPTGRGMNFEKLVRTFLLVGSQIYIHVYALHQFVSQCLILTEGILHSVFSTMNCVQNRLLDMDESIYIPITKPELTILKSAFNVSTMCAVIIPYLLGWHAFAGAVKPEISHPNNTRYGPNWNGVGEEHDLDDQEVHQKR